MTCRDQGARVMAGLSGAIGTNRRLRIFGAVALTILLIAGLSPHVGGAVGSVIGLAVLFVALPARRERANRGAGQ
ncbi:hypothetical protein [Rhodalgimonas zhirmunskyi]|uniref:Uncharacterized protein n=1 Tax=Rhodalgimonas zhirmunskyi TaxID=2964767 RepID=A0AAJ1X5Z3_9RHOB|nr:hypothetical protein [Rhodoalgimonas zhirmunskyi]MDQ2095738.1 hypothetical protein [Rhodoalgimonas zhirmunskyi]